MHGIDKDQWDKPNYKYERRETMSAKSLSALIKRH